MNGAKKVQWDLVAALITVFVTMYSTYFVARKVDQFELDERVSSAAKNSLYFFTTFSRTAPILYLVIQQAMQIGSDSITHYTISNIAFACIAYASLSVILALNAARRSSKRNLSASLIVNPAIALSTHFLVLQMLLQGK